MGPFPYSSNVDLTLCLPVFPDLRAALVRSHFFANHEVIGSSLLFLYDQTGEVGVWMIDFGKTNRVKKPVSHHIEWTLGNHEDGYLIGLDSIKDIITESLDL